MKYAEARGAVVSLGQTDGVLTFEVKDDGRGFDTAGSTYGTGLQEWPTVLMPSAGV